MTSTFYLKLYQINLKISNEEQAKRLLDVVKRLKKKKGKRLKDLDEIMFSCE
jgi:hypothetical protein